MQITGILTEPLVQMCSCVSEVITMMKKLGYITSCNLFFKHHFLLEYSNNDNQNQLHTKTKKPHPNG